MSAISWDLGASREVQERQESTVVTHLGLASQICRWLAVRSWSSDFASASLGPLPLRVNMQPQTERGIYEVLNKCS